MALGGTQERVFRLVLREGMGPVLIGLAAGGVTVLAVAPYVKILLYGVSATDPITLVGVAVALILTAAIAIAIPARRASQVDPTIALRCQ